MERAGEQLTARVIREPDERTHTCGVVEHSIDTGHEDVGDRATLVGSLKGK